MLKTLLIASSFALTVPAFAQDTPQAPANPQMTEGQATVQAAPGRQPIESATPAAPQSAPVASAQVSAQPQPAQVATATPAPATPAEPVTGSGQIAQVVSTEFPTYDKNADAKLDKREFGAWMVALKTASDPATKATDPATTKWIDGAFASADTDKSKSVTQAELTKYLSQGAAAD